MKGKAGKIGRDLAVVLQVGLGTDNVNDKLGRAVLLEFLSRVS